MAYKSNVWYKIGLIITLLATAEMSVCFILMGFGNDGAIVWFFLGCVFLVIGFLLMQTIRTRYERAEKRGIEPPPMFSSYIRMWNRMKEESAEKGVFSFLFKLTLIAVTSVTVILAISYGYFTYAKNGMYNNPEYRNDYAVYETYREKWQNARKGDDPAATHFYYSVMEKHHNDTAIYRKYAGEYEQSRQNTLVWLIIIGTVDIILISVYIILRRINRRKSAMRG